MDVLDIRESVSAATHGLALLAALPAVAMMIRQASGDKPRVLALAAYGFGLAACLAASTVCHALVFVGHNSAVANTIDHIGIFLLIAGTYTPIAATLLPTSRRRATLVAVWLVVVVGVALNLIEGPLPAYVATSFYLAMGWGGLWCYVGVRSRLSRRELILIPLGGVLYSVGAMFHLARWPVLWPGVFGGHELFHLFVVAGATAHFVFIWRYVARPLAEVPLPRLDLALTARPLFKLVYRGTTIGWLGSRSGDLGLGQRPGSRGRNPSHPVVQPLQQLENGSNALSSVM